MGSGDGPAGLDRPAARRLVPRVPQPPRAAIDLRDPPRNLTEQIVLGPTSRSSCTPASSSWPGRRSTSCCPTTSSRASRARALGRLGLIVHATAGFVDPGFKGTLTLEVTNLTRIPIELCAGLPIAQLSFMALDAPAERPYGHPDLGATTTARPPLRRRRYAGARRGSFPGHVVCSPRSSPATTAEAGKSERRLLHLRHRARPVRDRARSLSACARRDVPGSGRQRGVIARLRARRGRQMASVVADLSPEPRAAPRRCA